MAKTEGGKMIDHNTIREHLRTTQTMRTNIQTNREGNSRAVNARLLEADQALALAFDRFTDTVAQIDEEAVLRPGESTDQRQERILAERDPEAQRNHNETDASWAERQRVYHDEHHEPQRELQRQNQYPGETPAQRDQRLSRESTERAKSHRA
jgi:hypothetical protein